MCMDVSHSPCKYARRLFFSKTELIWLGRQAFASFQHGFLRSKENVKLHNFMYAKGVSENIGKYHLPHIWDEVLFNTSELKIKINWPSGYSICHMAITSANTPTQQWLFHLPHGNNICQISIYCGYSICHLATTSAIAYT